MGTLKKNFLYNIVYQILQVLLPLVTAPYISRTLGADALGVYAYTNSVAYYFILVAMLGIANYGNRSVASIREDRDAVDKTFSGIFRLQAINFIAALIGYIVYLVSFKQENYLISALQIIYLLSGLLDISWVYFGLEKFKTTVTRSIVIKLATVVLIFLFVRTPADLWKYTLIMVLGSLFGQLYLWKNLKRYVSLVPVPLRCVLTHFKPALILFVPVLAYSIYKVMDKIMLGNMCDYSQVGFYSNAEKIVNIPMGVITALGTVMLPRLSNQTAKGKDAQIKQYFILSVKFVTVFSAAIGFGLIGVSDVFTKVFFGDGFEACAPLIRTMAISVFFISWASVIRTQYLIPNHCEKIYLLSTTAGAIVNLILNLCLIPTFQARGAAIGSIMAEASVFLVQAVAVRKELPIFRCITEYIPVVVIGIAMSVGVIFLGNILTSGAVILTIQVCCGGGFFCLSLLIWLKCRDDDLWQQMSSMISGSRKQ